MLERPGNMELTESDRNEFTTVSSFADINIQVISQGKRKLNDEEIEVN